METLQTKTAEGYLNDLRHLFIHATNPFTHRAHVLAHTNLIIERYAGVLAPMAREVLVVAYLNRESTLIADERWYGDSLHVAVDEDEVAEKARIHSACAAVMVHNHPSGDPSPSVLDHNMTLAVQGKLAENGRKLVDHVIIGHRWHFSFRLAGIIGGDDRKRTLDIVLRGKLANVAMTGDQRLITELLETAERWAKENAEPGA